VQTNKKIKKIPQFQGFLIFKNMCRSRIREQVFVFDGKKKSKPCIRETNHHSFLV
jgi:hypothetical protein